MLPRKKEIILYATLTDYQKKFQEHLINRTLEGYLIENVSTGISVILNISDFDEVYWSITSRFQFDQECVLSRFLVL